MFDLEELRAKFDFWRAKRLKVNKDYEFMLDVSRPDSMAIRILKRFPGVIVEYSDIQMQTEHNLGFNFDIIANPNLCNVESTKFKKFTMDVFRSIVLSSIESAMKDNNENGNSDTVESDSERSLHEESVTVPEDRVPDRKPRKKTVRRSKKVHSQVQ